MTVDRIKFLLESLALKNGGRAKMCKEAQEALQLLATECGEQETLNAVNALLGVEAAKFALAWVLEGSKLSAEPGPTPEPVPAPSPDAIDITGAKLLSKHAKHRVDRLPIAHTMNPAHNDGKYVYFSGVPSNWGEPLDGRCYLFWVEGGTVYGGHFDWHKHNQTKKGLENVHGGYLDGKQPPKGSAIYVMLADNPDMEGAPRKRTNVVPAGTW